MADIWIYEKDEAFTRGADHWQKIDSTVLTVELQALIGAVLPAIEKHKSSEGGMYVAEVELSLTVSASGKVGFIGSGVEAGAEASIKIILKRDS
jgi:hypothetical protein